MNITFSEDCDMDAVDVVLGGLVGTFVTLTLKTGEKGDVLVTSFGEFLLGGFVLNYESVDGRHAGVAVEPVRGQAEFDNIERIHYL